MVNPANLLTLIFLERRVKKNANEPISIKFGNVPNPNANITNPPLIEEPAVVAVISMV